MKKKYYIHKSQHKIDYKRAQDLRLKNVKGCVFSYTLNIDIQIVILYYLNLYIQKIITNKK